MSLSYAILAILADKSCSGYDLAKQFDASVGYFWAASHQQIYRELNRLKQQGWVQGEAIAQVGRPNKTLYSITPLGQEQMTAWIQQPSKISSSKEELLVKLFAGYLVDPPVLLAEIQRYRQCHEQQLATYRQIEQQHFSTPQSLTWSAKCQYLTLRQGIRYEESLLAWCDEAIASLSDHNSAD